MKRLLIDAIFIFIFIYLGTHLKPDDTKLAEQNVDEKIENFEDIIAQKKEVKPQVSPGTLNEIHENKASQIAKGTSEFIVDMIDTSVQIISEIYKGITK